MFIRDLVYAVRTLRKDPAFTLTTVLTIAVLLQPLPYGTPDYDDLRKDATASRYRARSGGEPEMFRAAGVTPNFFSLLGRVVYGRDFEDKE